MARLLFVAGDPSGDERAAQVVREIKRASPQTEVWAVGGASLRKAADKFIFDLVAEGVMGFWEPLKKLPRFWEILEKTVKPALAQADVVVPTDFYGFNGRVAKAAKAAGKKVVYFVSPQVWASRPGRVKDLKESVDRMLVIFPFEEELYRKAGVPVTYVGHPLVDQVPEPLASAPQRVEPAIGLLPGSRPSEVKRHLPLFLEAAERLAARRQGLRFVLFAAASLPNDFYDDLLDPHAKRPYMMEIVRDEDYQWRRGLDFAITCSGTATLENALLGVPMVVVYKTSWVTYALAKALIQVKYVAMPNILAGKELVPELLQQDATPQGLADAAWRILDDASRRRQIRQELLALRVKLGGQGAATRAARAILEVAA